MFAQGTLGGKESVDLNPGAFLWTEGGDADNYSPRSLYRTYPRAWALWAVYGVDGYCECIQRPHVPVQHVN
jgi:hypothetical protein